MTKSSMILEFLETVYYQFGRNIFTFPDHWNREEVIALQKDNKLIYVEYNWQLKNYYYECELLSDGPEIVYTVAHENYNASLEEVLDIMSKFFSIERKSEKAN